MFDIFKKNIYMFENFFFTFLKWNNYLQLSSCEAIFGKSISIPLIKKNIKFYKKYITYCVPINN